MKRNQIVTLVLVVIAVIFFVAVIDNMNKDTQLSQLSIREQDKEVISSLMTFEQIRNLWY